MVEKSTGWQTVRNVMDTILSSNWMMISGCAHHVFLDLIKCPGVNGVMSCIQMNVRIPIISVVAAISVKVISLSMQMIKG